MTAVFRARPSARSIEIENHLKRKNPRRMNQDSDLFWDIFNKRDNIKAPIQDNFSSRTDLSIFTSVAPGLLDQSNETSWIQWNLQASYFRRLRRSHSSSEVSSRYKPKSDAWSHLEESVVSSSHIVLLQIMSSGGSLRYNRKSVGPRKELQHWLDSPPRASQPEPLKAIYYRETAKQGQIRVLKFQKIWLCEKDQHVTPFQ